LFKPEFVGKAIVALAPKTYYVKGFGSKDKFSSKGIQKSNCSEISFDKYKAVLLNNEKSTVINRGMRIIDNKVMGTGGRSVFNYELEKVGLSAKYDKRVVMNDKVTTYPLSI
jgi:hypothetical protein